MNSDKFVQIRRDPFGRSDTVRHRITFDATCKSCGQTARFTYGEWPDDRSQPYWDGVAFCGVTCRRDWFGQ